MGPQLGYYYPEIVMGANIYQDRGDTRVFRGDNRINDPTDRDFDATLEVSPKNDVGFFGGVKLGYVFGAGVVRPTIEGDFFYNGFRGGADFTLRDRFGDTIGERNVTTWINSGAFMIAEAAVPASPDPNEGGAAPQGSTAIAPKSYMRISRSIRKSRPFGSVMSRNKSDYHL